METMNSIELTYGDGFSGRAYYLNVDSKAYDIHHSLGSDKDENIAKEKAAEILKSLGIEADLSEKNFKWNGAL